MLHFTDKDGNNAIRSQIVWRFKAHQQRAEHLPFGAFFTTLEFGAPAFSARTRIPKDKQGFFFRFQDAGDLKRLDGGRGAYIFYSPTDYDVGPDRQAGCGPTGASGEGTGS